ncbi:NRDE family protein [Acinetobacter sp. MD2]|uniref:NRDE family protein n=1 Tax=Acinetobacter sp. MD2 TaxID=2600066 RepID=UPI002D1EDA94|nr:NRDE family protein [Acinetobacter sp. MD2]MEB3768218.1 NRDE family protein [Acinetobacter sp. MD2]
MCIVAIVWQVIENMPLCLISNRDEFYQRPSQALHVWPNSEIIAGQDVQAGGTWLGLTQSGRWAVITNHRDGHDTRQFEASRGQIITKFLNSELPPIRFAKQLEALQQQFSGFHILIGTRQQAVYMSNRGEAPQVLANGVYVLSNTQMGDFWQKTQHLRTRFCQELLPHLTQKMFNETELEAMVWDILQDQRQVNPKDLPNTGIASELEHVLSSSFIQSPYYGTRSSNFLRIYQNNALWYEKLQPLGQQIIRLNVPLQAETN